MLTLLQRCQNIRRLSVSMDKMYTAGRLWKIRNKVSEALKNIEYLSISRLSMRNMQKALTPCAALKELTLHR